ncbi:TPA: hypothetical protein ACW9LQ_003145 [Enterobacter hormaechei]|uniref:hypothetical protein n=1 Tax=Enterobacter TaxID=547 RepID=UPI000735BDFD|nr:MULTISPECIES: hypothetical protein [Enterobacter]EMD2165772.1 hypothetical protein [Enterobacter hormaechei]ELN8900224.1 hypothetical protein [Enterobacter hormaechei subsp. xiangfangensis]KTI41253.1 hypothetical protein ASV05_24375 [Enterobacter hormaechei subsp. xiangfangensis]KTJ96193.1 hypothetical protein ASU73_08915 [Enterobacter hormaechei subsp. xiangfangensis]MEA3793233.1 hypothetical protein [Enterobacter hormaechei]
MSTITKERLEPVIERLEHYATNVKWTNVQAAQDMLIAVDAMRRLLASLEAEPVAWRNKDSGHCGTVHIQGKSPIDCGYEPLYLAPPAPVSVPDAMEMDDDFDSAFEHGKAVGWNAYRAAMLQSFGNSEQLNSPVIPDCSCGTCRPVTFTDSRFVVCSECGNKRCPHANDHRNACTGSNEPGQEGGAYPAAPRQEVK